MSIRVAMYIRAKDEFGFETQHRMLKWRIEKRPDWEFAGVYSDKGYAPPRSRTAFCQMIEDCKMGKIDLVIVSSVSKLSRKTQDLISALEDLKPVDVFFETEQLYTSDGKWKELMDLIGLVA